MSLSLRVAAMESTAGRSPQPGRRPQVKNHPLESAKQHIRSWTGRLQSHRDIPWADNSADHFRLDYRCSLGVDVYVRSCNPHRDIDA